MPRHNRTADQDSTVTATELKVRCAEVLERVIVEHRTVTVTRRGKPVARIMPIADEPAGSLVGYARGGVTVTGDLLAPLDVEWEAAE
jgi:prevent-host-death family protein